MHNKLKLLYLIQTLILFTNFKSVTNLSEKNKIQLITMLYNEKNSERINEYITCLEKNLRNSIISSIHVIYDISNDSSESKLLVLLEKMPVYIHKKHGRATYNDCIKIANQLKEDSIAIIANADIYFNETLSPILNYDLTNKFLALTRWEVNKNGSIEASLLHGNPRTHSQDAWIFKTPISNFDSLNIELGTWGCDNGIALEAQQAGLIVINPCLTIQCCHLHLTNIRHYPKREGIFPVVKLPWAKL